MAEATKKDVPVVILGDLARATGVYGGTLRRWMDAGLIVVRVFRVGPYRAINRTDMPAAVARIRELQNQRGVPAI